MDEELSAALVRYTSKGVKPYPWPDEGRAVEGVPVDKHEPLLGRIKSIVGEMFAIQVDWGTLGYQDGVTYATSVIRQAHPELTTAAINSLDWLYSYDMR